MRFSSARWAALFAVACADSTPDSMAPVTDELGHVPSLACPGGPGCGSGEGRLLAGAKKREITPVVEPYVDLNGDHRRGPDEPFEDRDGDGVFDPVWMAGFGRGRAATGVHDPQWLRVLSLRQGDVHVGIVVLDSVGYFHDEVLRIRRAAREAGLDYDQIIVASTHDHEAKDTMGLWGETITESGWDQAYMDRIVGEAVALLAEAAASQTEVTLRAGQSEVPELISDSRRPIVVDGRLTAVAFEDGAGATIAVMVIWGNHAETLANGNQELSSDYPHYLREALEAHYPGATALFLPGNLGGMMSPLGVAACPDANGRPTCEPRSFAKAAWIGGTVADRAHAALTDSGIIDRAPVIAVQRRGLFLGVTNLAIVLGFGLQLFPRTLFDPQGVEIPEGRARELTIDEADEVRFQTEVGSLRLGPVEILTVPGELYPELWMQREDGGSYAERPENADYPEATIDPPLSGLLDRTRLRAVINQANDSLGYLVPKSQFDLEPPHAYVPEGQYGEENSLGPEAAGDLYRAAAAMRSSDPNENGAPASQ